MLSEFLNKKIFKYKNEIIAYKFALLKKVNIPKTKFFILCYTRTGSHLLLCLLNSHPEIHCETYTLAARKINKLSFPMLYLKGCCVMSEKNVYGFRAHPFHITSQQKINLQKFLLNLHQEGWKIIHLTRVNLLRQEISAMIEVVASFVEI